MDELVKRLRAQADAERYFVGESMLYDVAADAIEELSATISKMEKATRWIPVSERLPEAGERVLCYCRANIYEVMKMRTSGDWAHDVHHIYMHSFVTHWMPLPEPPKEVLTGTDMRGGIRRDDAGNVIDWGITGPPGDVGKTEEASDDKR